MARKETTFREDLDLFGNSLRELIDNPSYHAFDGAIKALERMKEAPDRPVTLSLESIENAINYLNDNIKDNLEFIFAIINDETQRDELAEATNELREDALWLQSSFPFFALQ